MEMDERTRNIATTCFASGCATFLALCITAPTIGVGWALDIAAGIGAPTQLLKTGPHGDRS